MAAGCAKKPSPEYEEAADRFNQIFREKWDETYIDPQMAEIEAKLASVPSNNMSAPLAQALLQRIREGRERVQAERARLDQGVAEAVAPPTAAPPMPSRPEAVQAEPAAEPQDAGVIPPPQPGMTVEDLQKFHGYCFRQGNNIPVLNKYPMGTYAMRDLPSCRDRYPALVNSLVVIDAGKIYTIVDKAKLDYFYPDGGAMPRR